MRSTGRRVRIPLSGAHYLIFAGSFDVELPVECDDEYWATEAPYDAFKQPNGVPSQVSYFIWMIKLSNIRARAIREIVRRFYSTSS